MGIFRIVKFSKSQIENIMRKNIFENSVLRIRALHALNECNKTMARFACDATCYWHNNQNNGWGIFIRSVVCGHHVYKTICYSATQKLVIFMICMWWLWLNQELVLLVRCKESIQLLATFYLLQYITNKSDARNTNYLLLCLSLGSSTYKEDPNSDVECTILDLIV